MTSTPNAAINQGTASWQDADRAHHLHPFTDTKALNEEGVRVITRADGVYLWDSEGNRILDGMAGLWCVNVGYGRRELVDAASRQMAELPYYNTFFKSTTVPAVALAEVLGELVPAGLGHAFFANSGSEANDTIVRMARTYWSLLGKPDKQVFISREFAYHGSTMAAASLCGMSGMHEQGGLPLPGFEHVMPPYWYRYGGDLTPDEFGRKAARAVEDKILEVGADKVAAFIGEPVMGAGGVLVPPDSYWPEIQRICREHDVLLVADEVICGFGRVGRWFASELYDIRPDFMPLAKGLSSGYLPISAVMVGDRVADVLIDEAGEFAHGFTYSGHPAAAAVALENVRIIREEKLVERVASDTGPYLQARLRAFADHPLVGEVRGVGLIAAIELVRDKEGRTLFDPEGKVGAACRDHAVAGGLVMRAVRDSMVLSPPLTITRAEIDELIERAGQALDLTQQDVASGRFD